MLSGKTLLVAYVPFVARSNYFRLLREAVKRPRVVFDNFLML
jgi:hypothetical protein